MKARGKFSAQQLFAVLPCIPIAYAQTPPPGATQPMDTRPAYTQAELDYELDQMLAPIALYPDALVVQVSMASTYPMKVVPAARWSRAHRHLTGEPAVRAVARYDWDPSVKSLVAFPRILDMINLKLEWMQRLGDAFLSHKQVNSTKTLKLDNGGLRGISRTTGRRA